MNDYSYNLQPDKTLLLYSPHLRLEFSLLSINLLKQQISKCSKNQWYLNYKYVYMMYTKYYIHHFL